jgi:hypothetical protein
MVCGGDWPMHRPVVRGLLKGHSLWGEDRASTALYPRLTLPPPGAGERSWFVGQRDDVGAGHASLEVVVCGARQRSLFVGSRKVRICGEAERKVGVYGEFSAPVHELDTGPTVTSGAPHP